MPVTIPQSTPSICPLTINYLAAKGAQSHKNMLERKKEKLSS